MKVLITGGTTGIIEGNELTTCTSPEFYIHGIKEP